MRLKTCSKNAEIKLSKVQTHNFDAPFRRTSRTGDGTKQFCCLFLSHKEEKENKKKTKLQTANHIFNVFDGCYCSAIPVDINAVKG